MNSTFDINDAADYLKVHPDTVGIMASKGKIPGAKVGRAWVFLESELRKRLRSEIKSQTEKRRLENTRPPPQVVRVGRRRRILPKLD